MAFEYEYARPALAVDCAVFGLDESLKVLLIERGLDPCLLYTSPSPRDRG